IAFVADEFAVVVEAQLGAESFGAEFVAAGRADAQARLGCWLNRLHLKLGRKVEGRKMGELEHLVEQLIGLCKGDDNGFLIAEKKKPVVGVVVVQKGEGVVENHQAAGGGEERAGNGHV